VASGSRYAKQAILRKHNRKREEARVFNFDIGPLGVAFIRSAKAKLRYQELDSHNKVVFLGRRCGHGHVGENLGLTMRQLYKWRQRNVFRFRCQPYQVWRRKT